jgi:hypothetical protein
VSVDFFTADEAGRPVGESREVASPCLCAQDARTWADDTPDPRELAAHANPECSRCGATGIEVSREWADDDRLNLANGNASALLGLLGFDAPDLCGGVSVGNARRAVAFARAMFAWLAPGHVRDGSDRVVGGIRVVQAGLSAEGLADRLERFAAVVERGAARGGVRVRWE